MTEKTTEMPCAEANRRLLEHTFTEVAKGNIDIFRTVLREDFIEHSPGNPSGRDAFVEFIAKAPLASSKLELKRVIADEEHVVVHYHMVPPGNERGIAVVDICRIEDGLIAEHWDVLQPVPHPDETPNGMF
ncbi:nuclear transport factor 2 family protein [Actinomadura sp. NPDC047616]|uniref:nuclear transport factor 2 family protein n=1 Tax=Actinomadura sp. NPDC047616 TaxID=3155914 RepID=UPI0033EDB805